MTAANQERRRPHGALKAAVLQVLLEADRALTAREITDALAGHTPSLTTVFTVLDRLRRSGEIEREQRPSGTFVFSTAKADPGQTARQMLDSLVRASDRGGALVAFAGSLHPEDMRVLRSALDGDPA